MRRNSTSDAATSSQVKLQDAFLGGFMEKVKPQSHCCLLINSFPLSCHGFVPRARAPLPTVDLPSPSLAQNRQYCGTVTCLPAHRTGSCHSYEGPNNMYQKWQCRVTTPPTHQQGETNNCGRRVNQRCTIMTKLVLCSNPHACAQTTVQQMMIVR